MLLKVANFTTAPGPRYISEGRNSGELFRKSLLLPMLQAAIADNDTLTVDLDGTSGYATSFLEECFGGLVRENGYKLTQLHTFLNIVSDEEPGLLVEVEEYLHSAEKAL